MRYLSAVLTSSRAQATTDASIARDARRACESARIVDECQGALARIASGERGALRPVWHAATLALQGMKKPTFLSI